MKWAGLETPKCVTAHQRVNCLELLQASWDSVTEETIIIVWLLKAKK